MIEQRWERAYNPAVVFAFGRDVAGSLPELKSKTRRYRIPTPGTAGRARSEWQQNGQRPRSPSSPFQLKTYRKGAPHVTRRIVAIVKEQRSSNSHSMAPDFGKRHSSPFCD
jgi:hypothetical protein